MSIQVKPLEWVEQISGKRWIADRYRVEKFVGGWFACQSNGPQSGAYNTLVFGVSFDDAKAAGQDDYEQRVLSAIDLEAHKALIDAKDAEIAKLREALLEVVSAVRDYLPPDGIDGKAFASRVIGAVDNHAINPIIKAAERINVDA